MTTTEIIFLIFGVVIVSFFLGYQFAKMRFMVREMLAVLKVFNSFMLKEIDQEEFKKRINEILHDNKFK